MDVKTNCVLLSFRRGPIVYTRDQLLALCGPAYLYAEKPDIPAQIRRRRRGCRAGRRVQEMKRRRHHRQDSCSSVESDGSKENIPIPDFEEESLFSSDEDKNEKDETSLLAAQPSEDKDGMKTSSRQQPAASAAC